MQGLFHVFGEIDPDTRIPPLKWGDDVEYEDYNDDYGMADYTDKVVLDLGADVGSTADFFLRRGARRVIAVEGDPRLYSTLQDNARRIADIIPIFLWISDASQLIPLIRDGHPNIVKADIEFAETHLLQVPDDIFQRVSEYIIETHDDAIFQILQQKCTRCGYEIKHIQIRQRPDLRVVYIKKGNG